MRATFGDAGDDTKVGGRTVKGMGWADAPPTTNGRIWVLALALLALGLASRFYRLGWSFSGDETSSFGEVRSLFEEPFFIKNLHPYNCQPRAEPVGYLLLAGTYAVFGQNEVGARTGVALAGAISIALGALLCGKLFGPKTAVIAGALLLLWPWHLSMSQANRVYGFAFLFGSASILLAALAWRKNSGAWGALAGLVSALAVSTHNLAVFIPISLGLFAVSEAIFHRGTFAKKAVAGYAVLGGPLLLASAALAWRMMKGWAGAQDWGGGSLTVLMGLAYALTWEVALVAVVGWVGAWFSGDPIQRLLAITAAVAGFACAVLPLFVPFRQEYVYSSSVCFMILAALTLARVHAAASSCSKFLAFGLVAVVLLAQLPGFASNYVDGDRKDYRAAAEYIQANMREGDAVAADTPLTLGHYLHREVVSAGRPSTNPKMMVEILTALKKNGARIWYVCRYAREEPAAWADTWLWENAVRMLRIKKKRFDYHENILDVYLIDAKAEGKATANPTPAGPS